MLNKLFRFFDKDKDIPINRDAVTMTREPNEPFTYYIDVDWEENENEPFYTAVDSEGFPIVFPGSDVNISAETAHRVQARMMENYPLSQYLGKDE